MLWGDECWYANGCPATTPQPRVIRERAPWQRNDYETLIREVDRDRLIDEARD